MLLLLCSIILVLLSAFFIANIFDSKNAVNNIIAFFLAAFANIVLTFEILSLFQGISRSNVLILNSLFAILSFIPWNLKKYPVLKFNFKEAINKFLVAAKLDKTILFMTLAFIFACLVSLWLISFVPGIDVDSTTYRVVRALFWVEQGSLNHILAPDPRMVMFPINSEILYAWFILFLKSDLWIFIFNFCGLGLFLTVLYGLLSNITASLRKKLWVLLITASIPFTVVRYTGLETGLIIAALVLCTIYFYIEYLKNKKKSLCFMAALALALGVGTKTTVILMMPALLLWCVWYSVFCEKKNFYKPIARFTLYFSISFLIFASYNYFLNYINYGHFISAMNVAVGHSNTDGFLSTFSNLYRYLFDFFSFPEYIWSAGFSSTILLLREGVLNMLNANNGLGYTFVVFPYVAHSVSSASSALGLFGPLLFIPLYIFAIYKSFRVHSRKTRLMASFVYMFLVTVFVMAYKLAFMSFNIRFFATFSMLTIPVLCYAYSKKYTFYKLLLTVIALFYLINLSTNITLYPVKYIVNALEQGVTPEVLCNITECSGFSVDLDIKKYDIKDVSCYVSKTIRKFSPKNKILFFADSDNSLMPIKRLMFEGYKIDIATATEIDKINMNDYNIIITCNDEQSIRTILSFDKKLDEYGYTHQNGVSCCYIAFGGDIIKDLSKDIKLLDNAQCIFTEDFYHHYNLKRLNRTTYRIGVKNDGSIERKTYNFYENLNNLVIRE